MSHQHKKRFGQHFLKDAGILQQIVGAAKLAPGEPVLEIGPGAGVLTEALLQAQVRVQAVEIDRDLCRELDRRFGQAPNFRLLEGDALKLPWTEILGEQEGWKLVANLPYNVSTPLFFKFVEQRQRFASLTLMLQKEVGDRLVDLGTGKGLKDYGILSGIAGLCFQVKKVCAVPPGAFVPPPKVDSVVLHLTPKPALAVPEAELFGFVRWGFEQRRKLLLSRLKRERPELAERLEPAGVQALEGLRPENLKPLEWLELYRQVSPSVAGKSC